MLPGHLKSVRKVLVMHPPSTAGTIRVTHQWGGVIIS
jgi:hypothetical protein